MYQRNPSFAGYLKPVIIVVTSEGIISKIIQKPIKSQTTFHFSLITFSDQTTKIKKQTNDELHEHSNSQNSSKLISSTLFRFLLHHKPQIYRFNNKQQFSVRIQQQTTNLSLDPQQTTTVKENPNQKRGRTSLDRTGEEDPN